MRYVMHRFLPNFWNQLVESRLSRYVWEVAASVENFRFITIASKVTYTAWRLKGTIS